MPGIASYADGAVVKLAKCGGIREAQRMLHVADVLGLQVMLGCMIESQLGIAQAAQLGALADHADLDGHLLITDEPYTGLGLATGGGADRRPGSASFGRERLAVLTAGQLAESYAETAHGVLRYGAREVVASSTRPTPDVRAVDVVPFATTPPGRRRPRGRAALGATPAAGVAPVGGKLTPAWRPVAAGARAGTVGRGRPAHRLPGTQAGRGGRPERARDPRPARVATRPRRAAGPRSPGVRVVHTVGSDCAIGE